MTQATIEKTWTDIAVVNSTKRDPQTGEVVKDKRTGLPLTYRIQQNGTGKRRCTCPGFTFSNSDPKLRDCKHLRQYTRMEQDVVSLTDGGTVCWPKAQEMLKAMLIAGNTAVGDAPKARMTACLAEELARFAPPLTTRSVGKVTRLMRFDED